MFSRKPPLPSFWQQAQWKDWLPLPSQQEQQSVLPSLPEMQEAREIIAALDPHDVSATPVPLSKALRAAQALDAWFLAAADHLTWPPTASGFSLAAQSLFASDASPQQRFVLGLLDALRPDLVSVAHQAFKLSGVQSWLSPMEASPVEPVPAAAPSQAKASQPAPPRHEASVQVKAWLVELRAQPDQPLPLLQEEFDGKIKRAVIESKGTGLRARNYWFEDVLLPALTDLDATDLRDVLKFWPSHQNVTFNDPIKSMEQRSFWMNLRAMDYEPRNVMMTEVLPSLIDASEWTDEQRFGMVDPMVTWIKGYPDLVRQRLDLWKAWGGDLDQEVALPAEEGALTAPTTSARQWLAGIGLDPDHLDAPKPSARRKRSPR